MLTPGVSGEGLSGILADHFPGSTAEQNCPSRGARCIPSGSFDFSECWRNNNDPPDKDSRRPLNYTVVLAQGTDFEQPSDKMSK